MIGEFEQYRNLRIPDIKTQLPPQGNTEPRLSRRALDKLTQIEQGLSDRGIKSSLIFYIATSQHQGVSLSALERELGVSRKLLGGILDNVSVPRPTKAEAIQRVANDPELKRRRAEGVKEKYQDPEYKVKHAKVMRKLWEDEEFRQKATEAAKRVFNDEEVKRKRVEGLSRKRQDPEFRARNAARIRNELSRRWQDPAFRSRIAEASRRGSTKKWQDPGYRERKSQEARELMMRLRQDPDIMRRQREASNAAIHERWQNPEFRERMSKLFRENATRQWEDPGFRERKSVGTREQSKQMWRDPEFRERMLEALRRTRVELERSGLYYLPTIHGFRSDIGFDAKSSWEANFARVLLLLGREFYPRKTFELTVTSPYMDLFNFDHTEIDLDFITIDSRGNRVAYEIMAHPLEGVKDWAKLEMLAEQYPHITVKPVTARFYHRLQRRFEERINTDSNLAGWETGEDNLKTNPEKYGVK